MTTTTLTKAARTIIAAATSNAAGATLLGTPVDLRTAVGGLLTIKTTNSGALGVQATVSILVAHNDGTTPAAAVAGSDWKTVYQMGTGVVTGTVNEFPPYQVPQGVMHLNVVVTGNTTNAVVCEAFLSETSNASSV